MNHERQDYLAQRIEELYHEISILRDQVATPAQEEPPIDGTQQELPIEGPVSQPVHPEGESAEYHVEATIHQEPPPELEVAEHSNPLSVVCPCQEGRYFPQAVLASFEIQDIPYRLWTSTTYSNGEYAAARNNVKVMGLRGTQTPYILMTDQDLVYPAGAWQAMIQFLEDNPDFGGICLSKHGPPQGDGDVVEPQHCDAAPMMARRSLFEDEHLNAETGQMEQIRYHNASGCECQTFCDDVRRLGMRIGFLTGWSVQHIHQTRVDG